MSASEKADKFRKALNENQIDRIHSLEAQVKELNAENKILNVKLDKSLSENDDFRYRNQYLKDKAEQAEKESLRLLMESDGRAFTIKNLEEIVQKYEVANKTISDVGNNEIKALTFNLEELKDKWHKAGYEDGCAKSEQYNEPVSTREQHWSIQAELYRLKAEEAEKKVADLERSILDLGHPNFETYRKEIAELQKQNTTLYNEIGKIGAEYLRECGNVKDLTDQNARLREALEKIVEISEFNCEQKCKEHWLPRGRHNPECLWQDFEDVARKALNHTWRTSH
jgi:predicted nuclease with TOPRIM domain